MSTPENIKSHSEDYKNQAWRQYSLDELGHWVALLAKRSTHRDNAEKRNKDLYDAGNYLSMMQAHLTELAA